MAQSASAKPNGELTDTAEDFIKIFSYQLIELFYKPTCICN